MKLHGNARLISTLAAIIGVLLIVVAVLYWSTGASSLPRWLPGFEVGSAKIHFKHGVGAFILGLGAFAYAWFQSGKKSA